MTYFDTDVLVNAAINQDPQKFVQSNDLIEKITKENAFQISFLSIQELGFVLAKLKETKEAINISLNQLLASSPVDYNPATFK
jgi:predicted nucleic acid-binding protein